MLAVDRLTIVAHDRFQDIVNEAKKGGYSFSTVNIGEDIPETPKQNAVVAPVVETMLGITPAVQASEPGESAEAGTGDKKSEVPAGPESKFKTPEEQNAASLALDAIRKVTLDPKAVSSPNALQTDEIQKQLIAEVTAKLNSGQLTMYPKIDEKELAMVVREATTVYVTHTIAYPRVMVLPRGIVRAGFNDFILDLSSFRLQSVSKEILVQHLTSDTREVMGALESEHEEERLEDYVVRGLIDFDDVSYDEQANLLYNFAWQVVAHLKSYLKDDDGVRNVMLFHQRQISSLVQTQMQKNTWEEK